MLDCFEHNAGHSPALLSVASPYQAHARLGFVPDS